MGAPRERDVPVRSDRLPPDESTQGLLDRLRRGARQALDVLLARLGPRLKRWAAGRLPQRCPLGAPLDDDLHDQAATPHALWLARRDGRGLRSLEFSIAGWTQTNGVSMHPDGSAIAYTVGDVSWDVSRLVNFLTPDQRSTRF